MSAPGVWAEDVPLETVQAVLPALAALHAPLHLGLTVHELGDRSITELTHRARDLGVMVRAWLLLPAQDGYWLGTQNAPAAARAVQALIDWQSRPDGPYLDGITFDLEPPHAATERMRSTRGLTGMVSQLKDHLDRESHNRARNLLFGVVGLVKEAGLRAHCVTYPLVLDQEPGVDALEDALEIPVSGIPWDEISFMTYQTAFAQQSGTWLGPALIRSYAKTAVARFGDRAGFDLGVIGDPGVALDSGHRYPDPDVLAADVLAALREGIPVARMRVYGLAGILAEGGLERWLTRCTQYLLEAAPTPRKVDERAERAVAGVRNLVSLASRMLNGLRD